MRAFVSLILLTVALFCGAAAQAHTGLLTSSPANGATAQGSPPAIELAFAADVRLVNLQLATAEGQSVALDQSRDMTPARHFRVPLPVLGAGDYQVDWVVMGGDSHKMTGSFVFTIEATAGQ